MNEQLLSTLTSEGDYTKLYFFRTSTNYLVPVTLKFIELFPGLISLQDLIRAEVGDTITLDGLTRVVCLKDTLILIYV